MKEMWYGIKLVAYPFLQSYNDTENKLNYIRNLRVQFYSFSDTRQLEINFENNIVNISKICFNQNGKLLLFTFLK